MSFTPAHTPENGTAARRLGAILAGGQSSRFGRDKAEAHLNGKRLIDHVAETLAPQVAALVVAGGPQREGLPCVPDRPSPGLGPLGGLNAALHAAKTGGFDWVLTAPCDAARLPADLAVRLAAGLAAAPQPEALAAYACADGRDHPTFGLWSARLSPRLDTWLAASPPPQQRAIRRWAATIGAVRVPFPSGAFANVNTPEDLAALARRS